MAMCVSCGDYYTDRRLDLGYRTCLNCGDAEARAMTFRTHKQEQLRAYQ